MTDFDDFDEAENALEGLNLTLAETTALTTAFDLQLAKVRGSMVYTNAQVSSLSSSFANTLRKAFDGVVFDGLKLSDALHQVAQSMAEAAYSSALKPVQDALGGTLADGVNGLVSGIFGFSHGGAFSQGRVMPFAKGGVVTSPTYFPMRGATGLMGEAGPEAIMPLARGADGRLGVKADGAGGQPVSVTMNIQTPDVEGFRRSRTQIAAEMGRALTVGKRNR